eukprot:scaffold15267_cov118-Isochrysis_galbana.AAC.10
MTWALVGEPAEPGFEASTDGRAFLMRLNRHTTTDRSACRTTSSALGSAAARPADGLRMGDRSGEPGAAPASWAASTAFW